MKGPSPNVANCKYFVGRFFVFVFVTVNVCADECRPLHKGSNLLMIQHFRDQTPSPHKKETVTNEAGAEMSRPIVSLSSCCPRSLCPGTFFLTKSTATVLTIIHGGPSRRQIDSC